MSREWKRGEVAMVAGTAKSAGVRAIWQGNQWATSTGHYLNHWQVAARPLVVIDPEDREAVERLLDLYFAATVSGATSRDDMQAALREFADPKPPRIDEPGTWGVVEASCVHSDERRKWARHEDDNWYPMGPVGREAGLPDDWDSLKSPVLIRDGVS